MTAEVIKCVLSNTQTTSSIRIWERLQIFCVYEWLSYFVERLYKVSVQNILDVIVHKVHNHHEIWRYGPHIIVNFLFIKYSKNLVNVGSLTIHRSFSTYDRALFLKIGITLYRFHSSGSSPLEIGSLNILVSGFTSNAE